MRIAIIGSRSITDPEIVFTAIDRFVKDQCVGKPVIISGGAKGIDELAKKWAGVQGLDFIEFLPYHLVDKGVDFSPKYFFARNRQIIQNADKVLAIWDGESTGTLHSIRYAQKIGVPVMIIKHFTKESSKTHQEDV